MSWLIKKLKSNLRLIIQQMNKLKKYEKHRSELIDGEKFVYAPEGIIICISIIIRYKNHVSLKKCRI